MAMERWTGFVKVSLDPNNGGPFFRVAASLLVSPSKTLAVPSLNAIFFNGDRVEGTGDPVIERLSDPANIARLLVSKFGCEANAWVLNASTFRGPFAVYKEFVPSVNSRGDPKNYDPDGFHASTTLFSIISKSIELVKSVIPSVQTEHVGIASHSPVRSLPTALPKTVILGFSKGGVVVNQIISELAHWKPQSAENLNNGKFSPELHEIRDHPFPSSKDGLLYSISEFHYVDVGLNCPGAYLTNHTTIRKAVENMLVNQDHLRFVLHGTPRQWCDQNRPRICMEKDLLLQVLKGEEYEGKLEVDRIWEYGHGYGCRYGYGCGYDTSGGVSCSKSYKIRDTDTNMNTCRT